MAVGRHVRIDMTLKLCSISFCNVFVSSLFLLVTTSNVFAQTGVAQLPRGDLDAKAYRALVSGNQDELARWRTAGGDPARYAKNNPEAIYDAMGEDRDVAVLEFVLKSGANPNAQRHPNLKGTPILVNPMDRDKVALLLKYGADVNAREVSGGYTALSHVLFYPFSEIKLPRYPRANQKIRTFAKLEIVRLLVDKGAEFNGNFGGWGSGGALGHTKREDKDVIDFLIQRGATLQDTGPVPFPSGKRYADRGPLTVALQIDRDDLALALLKRDKHVASNDSLALLQATRRGWRDVAAALLSAGADPNAASVDRITPLAMAERRRDKTLVNMLVAAGAKASTQAVKPSYKIEGWSEFEKAVANEVDEVALFDPPRFTLNLYLPRKENPFALYGKKINQNEEVKCELSVGFTIIANAGIAGSISAGVCTQEAKRLRELAASAKRGMDMLLDVLIKEGAMKANEGELAKFGWVFEKKTGANQSDIFYFPVIVIGHGVLDAPTVVLVSENEDKAIIVQASVMNLCGEGRSMKSQTPLCSDTKSAITDIAQQLFARFGEK